MNNKLLVMDGGKAIKENENKTALIISGDTHELKSFIACGSDLEGNRQFHFHNTSINENVLYKNRLNAIINRENFEEITKKKTKMPDEILTELFQEKVESSSNVKVETADVLVEGKTLDYNSFIICGVDVNNNSIIYFHNCSTDEMVLYKETLNVYIEYELLSALTD